jgi:PAS domain S-box-containing protein
MSELTAMGPMATPILVGAQADAPAVPPQAPAHLVQFYEEEEVLETAVARFLGAGLAAGDALTVIATREHTAAFLRRLESDGSPVGRARASGQLLFLDAHETLARFMRDGQPDPALFQAVVGKLIAERAVGANGARLRAYGEMVDVLWTRGERGAAVRLEELWNDLQTRQSFTLLCAYAMGSFYKEPAALGSVCGTHTHVVGQGWDGTPDSMTDVQAASLPPQYAQTLAREIRQREEVEQTLRESLRELRRNEEALRRSEEHLRDFVENATIGLHSVGSDGTILWANAAELELLGYRTEEYVGRSVTEFHADQHVVADILARLARGEAIHDQEARLRAKDGSIKHVLISSNAFLRDGTFVHSRCFTRDITERRRVEEALRQSERQLQSVADALPVLVSYVGIDLRYRFVSAAYERWFARPKSDILDRRVDELIGAEAFQIVRPYMERALGGQTAVFEGEVPYEGAGTRFVAATYIPQLGEDGRVAGFVTLIVDITERKRFELFRAAAAQRAERLLKITAAVADAVTSDEVFEAVVDHAAAAIGASSAGLWLVDDDGRTARLARSIGYKPSDNGQFDGLMLDSTPSIPALDALRRGEPVWISSQEALLREYPHLRASATPGRSYRVACLPLISHGRTLGALGLTIDDSRETSDEERDFLLLVARYAGQAMERVRLLEAERRSRTAADAAAARMGVLSRASRTFVDADLDLARRLQDIVLELADVLGSCVGIALLEADGRLHTCAVHHPVPEATRMLEGLVSSAPLALGEGITGRVAQTGERVLLPELAPHELANRGAPAYRGFFERFPSYAMICVPLRARGMVIGTVTATRTRPGERYTADDAALLEELAERAAPAIENSRLHRENVAARARAEQLYHFAKSVVSAERVEDVFEAALDSIEGALGTKRGAILLYDEGQVMRFRAWRQLSDEYRGAVEGHSPWTPDTVAPQPVVIANVEHEPSLQAFQPLFQREAIGSLAFIPLITRGRLIGKFMVYYGEPHDYSSNELELAVSIANHLASVTARFAAISKLEETIRYNDLFAGALAHDLRNPLSAMMTAAQLLLMRQEGKGDGNAKPLSRILTSGQRMMRMIDQLLDLTRARVGGGIQIERCNANLADLCNQAMGELEIAHPRWRFTREVVGDQDGAWDPDRLLQLISNLVSNAGQHGSPESPIVVKLDGRRAESVTLQVHNEGAIPDAVLPNIFDPFRGTRQRRDYSRGLGLGLFIVKEIVRAHGGTVQVSSSQQEGTTCFTIDLPRDARLS